MHRSGSLHAPTHRPHAKNRLALLGRLSHALSVMQPLPETGEMLADELQRLYDLRNIILATYTESEHVLKFVTVLVAGTSQQLPDTPVDKHPLAPAIHGNSPTTITSEYLSDDAWLALPLNFGGSIVGVLAVGPAAQARRQQQLLLACADMLATAIYMQAHMELLELTFSEQSMTLAGISEIAQQLNATLDVQQIVEIVLFHALSVPIVQAGVVLIHEQDEMLPLGVDHGVDPAVANALRSHPLSLADFHDWDLHQKYQIRPIEETPAAVRIDPAAEALALFPLQRDGHFHGLLLLAISSSAGFASIQARFLKQLTAHAALALSNAGAYAAIEQQRQLLDRRLAQLHAVAHISQAITAHLNLDALLNEIMNVVQTTLGYESALLSLVDTQTQDRVRRVAAVGIPEEQWRVLREQVVPLTNYQTLMVEDFRISRSFYIPHDHSRANDTRVVEIVEQGYRPELGERNSGEWHANDLLLVPLYGHRGGLVGILSVDDPVDRSRPTPETIAVLEIFATQAATAIENARLYANVEQQALTDNLTGLANQRHFMLHLPQHVSLAERHGQGLALLALDIDHFKSFNDHYGHLSGNVVLREFADILRQNVRTGDQVARWGGEEFMVVLPQSTRTGALEVAERIRLSVRNHPFPHRQVSVSVGVAVFTPGMSDDDLLGAADAALYRAKVSRDAVSM